MKVAVQMDPIESVNIDADSTFALMLEAQRRGHALWHYEVRHMSLHEGRLEGKGRVGRLLARARPVTVQRVSGNHYRFGDAELLDLGTMDVVLMRQDPPFDMAYITATHMLEHIQPRTLVVNDPRHVRDAPEKLLVTHFPELMPPTLITWEPEAVRAFRQEYRDIIVKPLFGNGGAGVFRIREDDENLGSLLEMHWARSREPLMVQRYEPAVRRGDKRVILVEGEPMGAINRVPASGRGAEQHACGRAGRKVGADATRPRDLRSDRPLLARPWADLRGHRRDRRLPDRDQRDLADRAPGSGPVRRGGPECRDLGPDRGQADRHQSGGVKTSACSDRSGSEQALALRFGEHLCPTADRIRSDDALESDLRGTGELLDGLELFVAERANQHQRVA